MREVWNRERVKLAVIVIVILILSIVLMGMLADSCSRDYMDSYLALGQKYLDELDYEQAIAVYAAGLTIEPENEKCHIGLENASQLFAESINEKMSLGELKNLVEMLRRLKKQYGLTNLHEYILKAEHRYDELEKIAAEEKAEKVKNIYKWMVLQAVYPGDVIYRGLEFEYVDVYEGKENIIFESHVGKFGSATLEMDKSTYLATVTKADYDYWYDSVKVGDVFDFKITDDVMQRWDEYCFRKQEAYLRLAKWKQRIVSYIENEWFENLDGNYNIQEVEFSEGEGGWGDGIEDSSFVWITAKDSENANERIISGSINLREETAELTVVGYQKEYLIKINL